MPALNKTPALCAELVDRLALAGVDVEPERCDPDALRMTARDMIALAALLDDDDPPTVYVEILGTGRLRA